MIEASVSGECSECTEPSVASEAKLSAVERTRPLKCDFHKQKQTQRECDIYVLYQSEQGQIHGRTVADGWAGAVMQKPLAIQKCDGRTERRTDGPTDRLTRWLIGRVSATKMMVDIQMT